MLSDKKKKTLEEMHDKISKSVSKDHCIMEIVTTLRLMVFGLSHVLKEKKILTQEEINKGLEYMQKEAKEAREFLEHLEKGG